MIQMYVANVCCKLLICQKGGVFCCKCMMMQMYDANALCKVELREWLLIHLRTFEQKKGLLLKMVKNLQNAGNVLSITLNT